MSGDLKVAKADAKAAKARAKAPRPWYKKKRFLLPIVLAILVVIIAVASSGSKPTPNGNKSANGCFANPSHYPGAVPATDCVAKPDGAVGMAGTTITAKWSAVTGALGTKSICAAVTIRNHNTSQISYNDLYWQIQTPAGKIEGTNFDATNDLGSGSIVGGGAATGNVCFDDPGQAGTYIGLYQPDAFNHTRGVWLEQLT